MRAWLLFVLSLSGIWQTQALGAASSVVTVQINLAWEGRRLQPPNLEALLRFRQIFPTIPVTHLINPIYFLASHSAEDNWQAMGSIFHSEDEAGLYLSGSAELVREAGLLPKLAPTFWGYSDEGDVCQADCGLDVPLAVYSREELLKIFNLAHQTLLRSGFQVPSSLAVRGWIVSPFLREIAAMYGYKNDLTQVDPQLLQGKLREFPLATWVSDQDALGFASEKANLAESSKNQLHYVKQAGGILELNENRDILARFDQFIKLKLSNSEGAEVFSLGVSAETAFQTWPKLKLILESMQDKAKKQNFELEFTTPSGAKNGRPRA